MQALGPDKRLADGIVNRHVPPSASTHRRGGASGSNTPLRHRQSLTVRAYFAGTAGIDSCGVAVRGAALWTIVYA